MRTRLLLCTALLAPLSAACVDDPTTEAPEVDSPPDPGEVTAVPRLAGEACTVAACAVGQCGMVDDGCRAKMWCGDCACASGSLSCELEMPQIWEQTIEAGTHTIIVTTLFPSTLDPVLHVINDAGVESAWDDNSAGGTRPRVTVTVPSGQRRRVVLRPKSDTAQGAAAVSIDGQLFIMTVRGRRQVFTNLRASDELEAIDLPGSEYPGIIYGMSADGEHITQRAGGNGVAGGTVLVQAAAASSRVFWLGNESAGQRMHLVRNDRRLSGHDTDGDGLGSDLEAALGTCTTLSGYATDPKDLTAFPCGVATDARDTDSDGLPDGAEVRGIGSGASHVPLRRWGANPRHKDLFAEVDGSQLFAGDNAPRMTAAQARYFSDVYGDRIADLTEAQRSARNATLMNPDQKIGISTHLDIGLPPESAADYTVYGNWGGYSWVPPSGGVGADPQAAWHSYLASNRVGVFRYALIYNGSGGQTATGATCFGCGSYAWASSNSGGSPTTTVPVHESGHAHGIAHSGPGGISYLDPNCKPNWPSIENYAEAPGFADGTGIGTLNNAAVEEAQAVNPFDTVSIARLRTMFQYRVDNDGSVDWNRDGVIAPWGTSVRAYLNNAPGGSCEFTRHQFQWVSPFMTSTVAPALARLHDRMFVFAGGSTSLQVMTSTDTFNCPVTASSCGGWTSSWFVPDTLPIDATRGVDVARVTAASGRQALVVVAAGATGTMRWLLRLDDGTWTTVQTVPIAGTSAGEPAIETLPDGRALLLYVLDDRRVVVGTFRYGGAATGAWEQSTIAQDCGGATILESAGASPGAVKVAFNGSGVQTWGLFAINGLLAPRVYDPATQCFRPAPLTMGANWAISGRPSGAWQPDPDNAMGGRLTVIATDASTDPDARHMTQAWSYAAGRFNTWYLGQLSGFDSGWSNGYGADAWFDQAVDDNLRVAWTFAGGEHAHQVVFYPRADGINDFPLVNYNDWQMLRFAICKNLAAQQASPVTCPPRPW